VHDRVPQDLDRPVRGGAQHQGGVRGGQGARLPDRGEVPDFLEASDGHPEFAAELPRFVEAIKEIFEPGELRAYLEGVRRVGALGHTASDEAYEELQAAGAIDEGPVEWAEQILRLERTKALLLS